MRAAVNLHNELLGHILRLPKSFYDTNPLGEAKGGHTARAHRLTQHIVGRRRQAGGPGHGVKGVTQATWQALQETGRRVLVNASCLPDSQGP